MQYLVSIPPKQPSAAHLTTLQFQDVRSSWYSVLLHHTVLADNASCSHGQLHHFLPAADMISNERQGAGPSAGKQAIWREAQDAADDDYI